MLPCRRPAGEIAVVRRVVGRDLRGPRIAGIEGVAVHVGEHAAVRIGAEEMPHQGAVARPQGEDRATRGVVRALVDQAVVVRRANLGNGAQRRAAGGGGLHRPDDRARVLVERHDAVAGGRGEDLALADAHAAVLAVATEAVGRDRRLPLPFDGAGGAVERDDAATGRVQIHDAVDDDRDRLLRRGVVAGTRHRRGHRLGGNVGHPRRAQLFDVLLVDLGQRRVPPAAEVAGGIGPVFTGGRTAVFRECRPDRELGIDQRSADGDRQHCA